MQRRCPGRVGGAGIESSREQARHETGIVRECRPVQRRVPAVVALIYSGVVW